MPSASTGSKIDNTFGIAFRSAGKDPSEAKSLAEDTFQGSLFLYGFVCFYSQNMIISQLLIYRLQEVFGEQVLYPSLFF